MSATWSILKILTECLLNFLQGIDNPKVIGFTATPYRLDNMYEWINGGKELVTHTVTKLINRLKERFWRWIIFNINNYELIEQGYLVPLRYVDKSIIRHSQIPTNISLVRILTWKRMKKKYQEKKKK